MVLKKTRILLSFIFAAFVLCPLPASLIAFQDNRAKAEECYEEFLEIMFSGKKISKEEGATALSSITQACELFPKEYRYKFGLAYIHKCYERWDQAEQFFSEAVNLAPTPVEAANAQYWFDKCALKSYIKTSKNDPPGNPAGWSGHAKSPTSANLDLTINTANPILPKDPEGLLKYLNKQAGFQLNMIKHDVFLLVGRYSTEELERHYQRGLLDFYRIFAEEYFPTNRMDHLVILISEDPIMLARIAKNIYPNANISIEEPYMGFFCGADNFLVATIGGGYGTLLHELMHALMAKNMTFTPSWVQEGMAMLYERSGWTNQRLIPLPNWRMDFILNSVPRLTDFDLIVGKMEYGRSDLAAIRLLFLFLEKKSLLPRFLQIQGSATNTLKVSEIVASFGNEYSEKDWQEYSQSTISNYRAEIRASSGTPSFRDTKFIQHALNRTIDAGLKEDGIWGSATVEKVKEFQRKYDLIVDGKVGELTIAKIEKEFSLRTLKGENWPQD